MIISIAFSWIGIKGYNTFCSYRYNRGIKQVLKKIMFCRQIAIIHNMDVFLLFSPSKKGIKCYVQKASIYKHDREEEIIGISIRQNNKEGAAIIFSSTGGFSADRDIIISNKMDNESLHYCVNLQEFLGIEEQFLEKDTPKCPKVI